MFLYVLVCRCIYLQYPVHIDRSMQPVSFGPTWPLAAAFTRALTYTGTLATVILRLSPTPSPTPNTTTTTLSAAAGRRDYLPLQPPGGRRRRLLRRSRRRRPRRRRHDLGRSAARRRRWRGGERGRGGGDCSGGGGAASDRRAVRACGLCRRRVAAHCPSLSPPLPAVRRPPSDTHCTHHISSESSSVSACSASTPWPLPTHPTCTHTPPPLPHGVHVFVRRCPRC
jgi:hypothetical protein